MLAVDALTYRYGSAPPALDGVSFHVAAGERVALVGPNGAGKTTLLHCLCGVARVPPGRVRIADLDPCVPADRRRLPAVVGVVFQRAEEQLIHASVAEDVAFGPLNAGLSLAETRERVAEALAAVGLTGRDDAVPFHLSGGEQRRVALAGALALRPPVLLLDEPTAFLDPRGRRSLTKLLAGLSQTLIVATHDLDLVRDACTRAILLDAGRVHADAAPAELLADAALMDRHF